MNSASLAGSTRGLAQTKRNRRQRMGAGGSLANQVRPVTERQHVMTSQQAVILALQVSVFLTVFGFGLQTTPHELSYLMRRPVTSGAFTGRHVCRDAARRGRAGASLRIAPGVRNRARRAGDLTSAAAAAEERKQGRWALGLRIGSDGRCVSAGDRRRAAVGGDSGALLRAVAAHAASGHREGGRRHDAAATQRRCARSRDRSGDCRPPGETDEAHRHRWADRRCRSAARRRLPAHRRSD